MLSAAEIAAMTATIASALDVSLPLSRKSSTPTNDGYGHDTTGFVSVGNVQVNIAKASTAMLQVYADVIGSQRALRLRAMQTTDIRQGDHVAYDGLTWLVHEVENAESYTWTKDYLMAAIA